MHLIPVGLVDVDVCPVGNQLQYLRGAKNLLCDLSS